MRYIEFYQSGKIFEIGRNCSDEIVVRKIYLCDMTSCAIYPFPVVTDIDAVSSISIVCPILTIGGIVNTDNTHTFLSRYSDYR